MENYKINNETFQFQASAEGWRKGKPFLIEGVTHRQAVTMAYGYALLFRTEVRCARVTGYENLTERNERGEILGNGIYIYHNQAENYFEQTAYQPE